MEPESKKTLFSKLSSTLPVLEAKLQAFKFLFTMLASFGTGFILVVSYIEQFSTNPYGGLSFRYVDPTITIASQAQAPTQPVAPPASAGAAQVPPSLVPPQGGSVYVYEIRNLGPARASGYHMTVVINDAKYDAASQTFSNGLKLAEVGTTHYQISAEGSGCKIRVLPGVADKSEFIDRDQAFGIAFIAPTTSWEPQTVKMGREGGKEVDIKGEILDRVPDRGFWTNNMYWMLTVFVILTAAGIYVYWVTQREELKKYFEQQSEKLAEDAKQQSEKLAEDAKRYESAGYNKASEDDTILKKRDENLNAGVFETEIRKLTAGPSQPSTPE